MGGSRCPDLMGLPGVSLASWAGLEFTLPLPLSPHQPIAQTCKLRPTTDNDSGPAPQLATPAPEHPTSPAPESLPPFFQIEQGPIEQEQFHLWGTEFLLVACQRPSSASDLLCDPRGSCPLSGLPCPYLYNEHLNLMIPKSLAPLYPPHSRRSGHSDPSTTGQLKLKEG